MRVFRKSIRRRKTVAIKKASVRAASILIKALSAATDGHKKWHRDFSRFSYYFPSDPLPALPLVVKDASMPHRRASRIVRYPLLVLAFLTPLSACGKEPDALQPYNAAIKESSISGISSGAFMAVQFGTAWSSTIKGVGIVAGGPFYCAQAAGSDFWNGYTRPIFTATGPCMKGPAPDVQPFIDKADELAASRAIDATSNLSHQKIYIFHGFNDTVVAQAVTDATAAFYRHYLGQEGAGNLFYRTTLGAGHAQDPAA